VANAIGEANCQSAWRVRELWGAPGWMSSRLRCRSRPSHLMRMAPLLRSESLVLIPQRIVSDHRLSVSIDDVWRIWMALYFEATQSTPFRTLRVIQEAILSDVQFILISENRESLQTASADVPNGNILTGQAEVRPELALAILERKFPQRWAKVSVVAAPPQHLNFNVADILQKVQERIAQQHAQSQLPPATIINAAVKGNKPHDPRPPKLTVVSNPAEDNESHLI
jgi:hypothetical protein